MNVLKGFLIVGCLAVAAVHAPGQIRMRISIENTVDHVQVRTVQLFADALASRAGDRMTVEVYPEARLFRDSDVVAALLHGRVEMALPGTWQLGRFDPSVGALLLPVFFGRGPEFVHRALDAGLTAEIDRRLQLNAGVVVLGRWIDLGAAHLFTIDRPLNSHDQVAGLRIRYAGGEANRLRLERLGATPVLIPWPEIQQRLEERTVDGMLTTFESIASARLWEFGIRNVFVDSQHFSHYVPLVSPQFWARLPDDLRAMIADVWDEQVDAARVAAADAQDRARRTLHAHGVRIHDALPGDLERWRALLLADQPSMIEALGIDDSVVRMLPAR
ncbi:MAG: ABC transporter substrate-binding protein [Spirochaetaceae bacterium]|nr:MAG: ABC transporter substrate-binding protein [Spirochaetaceae bacterium]